MMNGSNINFIKTSFLPEMLFKPWKNEFKHQSNCEPTPPLNQQQKTDNKLDLVQGQGRGG